MVLRVPYHAIAAEKGADFGGVHVGPVVVEGFFGEIGAPAGVDGEFVEAFDLGSWWWGGCHFV